MAGRNLIGVETYVGGRRVHRRGGYIVLRLLCQRGHTGGSALTQLTRVSVPTIDGVLRRLRDRGQIIGVSSRDRAHKRDDNA